MSHVAASITTQKRRSRLRFKPNRVALYGVLIIWALIAVYPFIWLVFNSFKSTFELYNDPFGLPKEFRIQNYIDAWRLASMGRLSVNSLIVAAASTVLAMVVASTCAFALSRFDFRVKSLVWAYILFGFLMPDSVRLLPLAIFTRKIGVYDSLPGLILIYSARGLPWNAFFLASFMETIPRELEEAAVMDGANMWHVFRHVIVPVSKPAVATMATFHVLYSWNEFMLALLLTASEITRTLPVGVRFLVGRFYTNEALIAAALIIAVIPAVIFFLLLQRHVVRGMTAGALAGV
jgi:raffinose/stachyose/melibiose transport system permease protein